MTVIKRSKKSTSSDLIQAIEHLTPFLRDQKETEAADVLDAAAAKLKEASPGSAEHKEAVAEIVEAFEGEHELMAYTFQRENAENQWTEAEELSQASARVITLARRMQ